MRGEFKGQKDTLAEVRRLVFLSETKEVKACAKAYLETGLVPKEKVGDAVQLAFATFYGIDYLLTWNHAHLANVETQKRLEVLNMKLGWNSPSLVSPETIPWASLGQSIRRDLDHGSKR